MQIRYANDRGAVSHIGAEKGSPAEAWVLLLVSPINQLDVPEQLRLWERVIFYLTVGFPDGSVVKNLLAVQETKVRSLGREDPLEKEMATHSSILAWRIPWTEDPGGLQSMGHKESDTT